MSTVIVLTLLTYKCHLAHFVSILVYVALLLGQKQPVATNLLPDSDWAQRNGGKAIRANTGSVGSHSTWACKWCYQLMSLVDIVKILVA